ncbi:low affinity immunoglobulin gamma Fc region receptor III-A isoform X2 [Octodon degus]|uniref:low affinity immunoglobulin gamma Fc region receptor III-A isoform X2 n=1 Tax=Octodon degus TaxID=10160 RepID=UPI000C9F60A9|nr:low affinity immunoglobulin gamma Fc region receptor III-A isoform X2 [Octodon degus]
MWHLLPPSALLLLVSSVTQADRSKAVVHLDPPWVRMLKEDSVTLTCQGAYPPEDNSTRWYHNGTRISSQNPSYFIGAAKLEHSGTYQCQTGLSLRSDSVKLQVHSDWVVLQTSKSAFREGEHIRLRCHSWRNKRLYKVTYIQNGIPKRFFHNNTEFHIPEATLNHSGSYFCRGLIGQRNTSSAVVPITVGDPASLLIKPSFPSWPQIAFCLVIGLLFAMDTGLYFLVQRDLRRSMRGKKEYNVKWSQDQDK